MTYYHCKVCNFTTKNPIAMKMHHRKAKFIHAALKTLKPHTTTIKGIKFITYPTVKLGDKEFCLKE